jgi:hypothetical protein
MSYTVTIDDGSGDPQKLYLMLGDVLDVTMPPPDDAKARTYHEALLEARQRLADTVELLHKRDVRIATLEERLAEWAVRDALGDES